MLCCNAVLLLSQDEHLKLLGRFRSLETVDLSACQDITSAGVSTLAKSLPELKSLSLYWYVEDGG